MESLYYVVVILQLNVVVLKDMTEEEFVAKYQEIIDNQEFARNEIGRLEQ